MKTSPNNNRTPLPQFGKTLPLRTSIYPPGSLAYHLERIYLQKSPQTRRGYDLTMNFIFDTLGLSVCCQPLLSAAVHLPLLVPAFEKAPGAASTKYQMKTNVNHLTRHLRKHGLPDEYTDLLKAVKVASPFLKNGLPYAREDVRKMLRLIESPAPPPYAIRFLFWMGFSGGPQIGDAASMMASEADRIAGKVRFNRTKTDGIADFDLVNGALACVCEKSNGDVFFLQELVDSVKGGKATMDDLDSPKFLRDVSDAASPLWKAFIEEVQSKCGPFDDAEKKSYKSFRQESTSHLLSANVGVRQAARMQGSTIASVMRYDFPEEWQLACVRDLREQHLDAIRKGSMAHYVLTDTELVLKCEEFKRNYTEMMNRVATKRHAVIVGGIESEAETLARNIAAALESHDQFQSVNKHALVGLLQNALAAAADVESAAQGLLASTGGDDPDWDLYAALSGVLGRPATEAELEKYRHGRWPSK